MRTLLTTLIILSTAIISLSYGNLMPLDSVGIEKINGVTYVVHRVDEKETLYALSRRYGAAVSEIVEANPQAKSGIEIGQILKIPFTKTTPRVVQTGDKAHIVQQGETLFSISRQYNISVADIKQMNGLRDNGLEIGQRLVIAKGDNKPKEEISQSTSVGGTNSGKVHVVKQSETLFAIARQYNISVADIKRWNNLAGNDISIGQSLKVGESIVKESSEVIDDQVEVVTASSENTQTNEDETDPFKESRVSEVSDSVVNAQPEAPSEQTATSIEASATKVVKDSDTDFEEVIESGLAELIEGTTNTRKYLALHRTASIGTIMRVKNQMNGQEVFVRVLGKLPDTDINNNVLIKISKAAYNRLGAIDQKFRVSVSYIP